MIPLVEMCNHESSHANACIDFDVDTGSVKFYAQAEIKASDKFSLFYGQRTNGQLLIHNGFACEQNPFDLFCLKLSMSPHDPLYQRRVAILAQYGLKCTETFEISTQFLESIQSKFKCFLFVKIFTSKTGNWLYLASFFFLYALFRGCKTFKFKISTTCFWKLIHLYYIILILAVWILHFIFF